jgi:dipeptidyl aminopeptidase/acylaminoacyl peptidase
MNNLASPNELYVFDPDTGDSRKITDFGSRTLADVSMGEFEQFSFEGAGGDIVYGFVVKPSGFKRGQKYPVAFLIHGGPQGSFSNSFHFRWNPQTYAGQGFAAVMIDFHGSTGYGQAFTDSISGDWGGKPLEDLKLGLAAAVERYEFLDGERVCALGSITTACSTTARCTSRPRSSGSPSGSTAGPTTTTRRATKSTTRLYSSTAGRPRCS